MAKLATTLFQLSCIFLLEMWSAESRAEVSGALNKPLGVQALKAKRGTDVWTLTGVFADLQLTHAPHADLNVKYNSGKVVINTTLAPEQASNAPSVSISGKPACQPPYALFMVDPDAPSRSNPKARSWLHWMVLNSNDADALERGEVAMPYAGPTPPKGTGPHRYVLLAYCQYSGETLPLNEVAPKNRNNFNLNNFANHYLSSSPFAGMLFYAENA
ncbi:protein D1-like [Haemaphysalis longicornis]